MKITRRQLQTLIQEEIRKVKPGCYKVYPKKPKRGKKRRQALSKKCKTRAAAKKHLAAIEISKSMNESLLLEKKYDQLMATLPGLSLVVTEDMPRGAALDLQHNGYIIASAELKALSVNPGEPCIPETMSVSTIHTVQDYQSLGIGELLLDLVFYYASTLDGGKGRGITTDFDGGNTPIINYMIQRALEDPSYYKQTTTVGNDKMDFFNKTSDPDDDCYSSLLDDEGVYELINDPQSRFSSEEDVLDYLGLTGDNSPFGTTSSWRKRGIESLKPLYDMLTGRQSSEILYRPVIRDRQFQSAFDDTPTADDIRTFQRDKLKERKEPRKGTGKKPKGSSRRLYTDENPKDTVSVKFRTKSDIQDTLSKKSFKSKPHNRQSQIINLIHQRVRAAYQNAKDPDTKKRLKTAFDYAKKRKESSKRKTQRMRKKK